jgi:hypothetical protein
LVHLTCQSCPLSGAAGAALIQTWAQSGGEADSVVKLGLFVPKPRNVTDHLRCGMPDLGTTVYRRPLASTAGDGE